MRRERPERTAQRLEYYERRRVYLKAHPYCQIFIEVHRMNEESVIKGNGTAPGTFVPLPWAPIVPECPTMLIRVPRSEVIHHRNKRRGKRLNDESEWMAASRHWHDCVEEYKSWARELGLLRNF